MAWIDWLLRRKRRSLQFTSLGTRFVLVTLAVGFAAINTGNNLLYLVLAMLLSMITLSGVLSEQCLRGLSVTRRLPSVVFAEEPSTVSLMVENQKRVFPSFLLHFHEATTRELPGVPPSADPPIFILAPQASRSVPTRTTFKLRGLHHLPGIVASTKFPFGLFTKRMMIPLPQDLLVYPALLPSAELTGMINPVGEEFARSRRGHGSGFFVLRDYLDSDDARMIHWKSSARQAKLMVREADEEEHREVTLVLDGHWPSASAAERDVVLYSARYERAISIAATLAVEWSRRGWRLGLIAGSSHLLPAHGKAHLNTVLKVLSLLPAATELTAPTPRAEREASFFTWSGIEHAGHPPAKRSSTGVNGGSTAGSQGQEIAPSILLQQRAPNHFWIVLHLTEETAWPAGVPHLLRHWVTCPNEPAGSDLGEE